MRSYKGLPMIGSPFSLERISLHCTTSVKLMLWVMEPLVAVTVMLYVPAGVPGSNAGVLAEAWFDGPDDPEPLAASST